MKRFACAEGTFSFIKRRNVFRKGPHGTTHTASTIIVVASNSRVSKPHLSPLNTNIKNVPPTKQHPKILYFFPHKIKAKRNLAKSTVSGHGHGFASARSSPGASRWAPTALTLPPKCPGGILFPPPQLRGQSRPRWGGPQKRNQSWVGVRRMEAKGPGIQAGGAAWGQPGGLRILPQHPVLSTPSSASPTRAARRPGDRTAGLGAGKAVWDARCRGGTEQSSVGRRLKSRQRNQLLLVKCLMFFELLKRLPCFFGWGGGIVVLQEKKP